MRFTNSKPVWKIFQTCLEVFQTRMENHFSKPVWNNFQTGLEIWAFPNWFGTFFSVWRSALHCCSINTTTFGDCSRFRYASLRGGHQKRREEEMIRRESFEGKTPERQNGTTKKRWSRRRRKSWPKTQDDGCRHIHADGRGRDRLFGLVLVSSIPLPLSFSWFATLAMCPTLKSWTSKLKES